MAEHTPEQNNQAAGERRVYIDYNATTPLRSEVTAAMFEGVDVFGNASSMHASGRRALARVEEARRLVEQLLGAERKTVIFTSGGSEANNMVLHTMRQLAVSSNSRTENRSEIITTAIEHPCVYNTAKYLHERGLKVTFLPVDEYGKVSIDALKNSLSEKTLLVSVMTANNEIGTVQDIKTIASLAKAAGALMHTDAVQAVGKIPVNVDDLGVDYLTVSAHKIYGP